MSLTKNMVGPSKTTRFALVLLLSVFAGSVSATQPAHAAQPPLTLDGVGKFTLGTATAQSLTTSQGHDVIILVIVDSAPDDNIVISSIVDSSGLTFTLRVAYTPSAKLWEYYARATSPLNMDNITVISSGDVSGWLEIQALAIHGANTRAIFDQNPSIPEAVPCPGPTCSASIQTSAFDFVIASVAINNGNGCVSRLCEGLQAQQGVTNILYTGKTEVDYAITTTSQSNVVYDCQSTETTDAMAIVVDAISFNGAFRT